MRELVRRVTEIGAVCEVQHPLVSYGLREYVELDDGQRVFWKSDRGWSSSDKPEEIGPGCSIVRQAMNALEDDGETTRTYFETIVAKLEELGLDFDPKTVYEAPFRVELGPELRSLLRDAAALAVP